jgi:hypothetical protein
MKLSSIELALLAELNLEMARAYDAVAEDDCQPPDVVRVAQRRRSELRARARMFRSVARRVGAEPALIAQPEKENYTGPERRRAERRIGERRVRERRTHAPSGGSERRINPDRRRGERRRYSAQG